MKSPSSTQVKMGDAKKTKEIDQFQSTKLAFTDLDLCICNELDQIFVGSYGQLFNVRKSKTDINKIPVSR